MIFKVPLCWLNEPNRLKILVDRSSCTYLLVAEYHSAVSGVMSCPISHTQPKFGLSPISVPTALFLVSM